MAKYKSFKEFIEALENYNNKINEYEDLFILCGQEVLYKVLYEEYLLKSPNLPFDLLPNYKQYDWDYEFFMLCKYDKLDF